MPEHDYKNHKTDFLGPRSNYHSRPTESVPQRIASENLSYKHGFTVMLMLAKLGSIAGGRKGFIYLLEDVRLPWSLKMVYWQASIKGFFKKWVYC